VFDILCREAVNQWLETDALKSVQGAEERIQSRINLFHDKMGFRWAVTLRENPAKVMGSCGYFSVRRGTQTVETGYELHPDYWRQGIMSEAPQVMIVFSFGTQNLMPVHRIEALVAPGNIASIRILEKFGFFKEGMRCEFGFWKGHYQDVFLYALLNKNNMRENISEIGAAFVSR
jgi:ribosomal-protein-alanine N-acetyltransferase